MEILKHKLFNFGVFSLLLTACLPIQPKAVRVDSDPNVQESERLHDKIEASDIDIFIGDHPDLDEKTKKDLRDGTISRHAAIEKLKQN